MATSCVAPRLRGARPFVWSTKEEEDSAYRIGGTAITNDHRFTTFTRRGVGVDQRRGHMVSVSKCGSVSRYRFSDGQPIWRRFPYGVCEYDRWSSGLYASLVVDDVGERAIVTTKSPFVFFVWSLDDDSFRLVEVRDRAAYPDTVLKHASMAIDAKRNRLLLSDFEHNALYIYSLADWSVVTRVPRSSLLDRAGIAIGPVAIDHELDRLIVSYTGEPMAHVHSLADMSLLFRFDFKDVPYGNTFRDPTGLCVVSGNRIVVSNDKWHIVLAFTSSGEYIDSLGCFLIPRGLSFEERAGLIVINTAFGAYVVDSDAWLPGTFVWRPERQAVAPSPVRAVVETTTMVRSLECGHAVSLLPNELLFEIFERL